MYCDKWYINNVYDNSESLNFSIRFWSPVIIALAKLDLISCICESKFSRAMIQEIKKTKPVKDS